MTDELRAGCLALAFLSVLVLSYAVIYVVSTTDLDAQPAEYE